VNLHVDVTDHTTSRHYTDIRAMIESADLPDRVQDNALSAFKKIAQAEAHIHGKDIDHVHFHEIGGIDSIVDIIGTFLAVDYLGVSRVAASQIPLGSGTIKCAHGRIPVPVPATLAILKGLPVTQSDANTEIVTPTGAAIAATLAQEFGPMPQMEIEQIGYGAGKRETGSSAPNLLRMVLGKPLSEQKGNDSGGGHLLRDRVMVMETNIDDMSPEGFGFVMDTLLEKGALDVSFTPAFMKKNRPGTRMEVICKEPDIESLAQVVLTQTTAIGVRFHTCDRILLKREICHIDTSLGKVQVKKVTGPNGDVRFVPEHDDCRQKALELDIPLYQVYERVLAEANPLDRDTDGLYKTRETKA
ncbi:MAG: nickel pincer cofactor biosynthesis protein LarC, partial [Desulfobacterales bacterium]|nr:nickel pincer cofactor biosynthesis protein LarC [Desulfobacterales bacterium]